jgi:hypothetical protein|tara:strand:- start:1004 stop:1792 length:789 start_codon:yes stop_codon:yes gene_type:complete
MATSKQVAEKAEAGLPSADVMDFFEENEGDGLNYDTSELQIPFLRLIQALSPQIKKSDSAYIAGSAMGDIFNTVTGEHWAGEEGITVIPCYQETKYLKFKPRDAGGGYMGELSKDDPDVARAQRSGAKEILPDGNELVKSDQHYCIVVGEDGVPSFGIVDMKSTQIKISRRWKTLLSMLKVKTSKGLKSPPIYGTQWKLKSVEESNDMGSWYNWTLENDGHPPIELIETGKAFRESIMSGEAKAVAEDVADTPHGQTEEAPF